jgi:hypothetical protein
MTGMTVEDWARAERISIETEGHFANPFNEFRARLKRSGQTLSSTDTAALWRGAAIARVVGTEDATGSAAAAAEVAPRVASDQEDGGEDDADMPEEAVAQVDPAVQGPECASPPAERSAPAGQQGIPLEELMQSHFFPIETGELMSDFEERVAQGLSSAKQAEYSAAETIMLDLILQAYVQGEVNQKGLIAGQVRAMIRAMAAKPQESLLGYANRVAATTQVYARMIAPEAVEDTLKTKCRRLLIAASAVVPVAFEGLDESMSSGSVKQDADFQTPGSPKRAEHWNIGTPAGVQPSSPARSPPFPGFNTSPGRVSEDYDGGSVAGSQAASDLALMVEEMRRAREQQDRKDHAQLERERSERAFRDAEMVRRDSKDRADRAELIAIREGEMQAQMNRDELERADRAERDRKQEATEQQRKLELEVLKPPPLRRRRRSRVSFR